MEPEFNAERNKKSFLWGKVNEEIKKVKPENLMTKDQVSRSTSCRKVAWIFQAQNL